MKRFFFEEDIFFFEEVEEVTPLLSTVSALSPFFFAVKTKKKTYYYFYKKLKGKRRELMRSSRDYEEILKNEGLGEKRNWREIPFPPEKLDGFPQRKRKRPRDIFIPLHILSPREKEVIFALFYDGLSEEETARTLGVSRRTVRTHKARALAKLKEALETTPP